MVAIPRPEKCVIGQQQQSPTCYFTLLARVVQPRHLVTRLLSSSPPCAALGWVQPPRSWRNPSFKGCHVRGHHDTWPLRCFARRLGGDGGLSRAQRRGRSGELFSAGRSQAPRSAMLQTGCVFSGACKAGSSGGERRGATATTPVSVLPFRVRLSPWGQGWGFHGVPAAGALCTPSLPWGFTMGSPPLLRGRGELGEPGGDKPRWWEQGPSWLRFLGLRVFSLVAWAALGAAGGGLRGVYGAVRVPPRGVGAGEGLRFAVAFPRRCHKQCWGTPRMQGAIYFWCRRHRELSALPCPAAIACPAPCPRGRGEAGPFSKTLFLRKGGMAGCWAQLGARVQGAGGLLGRRCPWWSLPGLGGGLLRPRRSGAGSRGMRGTVGRILLGPLQTL